MKVSLTKALETPSSDEETSSVVRFAIRAGTNVDATIANATLSGRAWSTLILTKLLPPSLSP